MNRPPAFQAYAADLLTLLTGLSPAAVGAIVRLWLFAWAQSPDQCSLIDDDVLLARTAGVSREEWKILRDEIQHDARPMFEAKNGRLISDYLHGELVKQRKYRKLQAEKGKLSAAKRSNRGSTTVQPSLNSSSSPPLSSPIPLSSSNKKEKPTASSENLSNGKESKEIQMPETIREQWNRIQGVVQCKSLDGELLARVAQLVQEKPNAWWDQLFGEIEGSNFLRGEIKPKEGRRKFRIDLMWALNPTNLGAIMSGKYGKANDQPPHRVTL